MQSYLFVGGIYDALSYQAADDAEFVQWPIGDTDSEVYARETLSVDDASVNIFRHQSLTPTQALARIVTYYKAWCVNRSGGRR